ncbi:vesicle formation at the endoplasmic reticulum [Pseudogymnoascus verrucosus]|uniref:tripeptidyl-peptidase II n=1 Tax=Pseudogymnoascus verrucosus TaxID=342668 RepID=A0A1B8G7M5_9PEZI|nr:vesicle formation at the endoplasmic reticulum [Pseudogymnoascus verrucosus]OBT91827.1 vesicle formation at the endoplasmic reticulum [Pseudogymnoascus verrucosus]
MRAGGIVVGLLSLVGSALAKPAVEVFESVNELPEGWTQVRTPAPETIVSLRVALEHPNQELFEQTLLDVSTPDHPKYGQHLTGAELKYMLKPRDDSTESVMTWLASSNVPASEIKNDGEWINFRATVAQAEELLSTKFYVYKHNEDNKEMIRTLEYSLPSSVAPHVLTIQPTTRFSRMMAQRSTIHDISAMNAVFGVAATNHKPAPAIPSTELDVKACNASITPACLRALYNVGDYQADPKGKSLFGVAGYLQQYAKINDLNNFIAKYAPYAKGTTFNSVGVNGPNNPQNTTEDDVEANLDIQYAVAMSYNIPVTYYSTSGLGELVPDLDQPDKATGQNEPYLDFITYLLSLPKDKLPQTITTSYGENEQSVPPKYAKKVCSMFGELGLRGVSVLFSSGDTGVGSACQTNDGKNTTRFLPIFPAACPWVTSVGGTYQVQPERAVSFSSGGFSDLFPRPKYQDKAVKGFLRILGDRWKGLYNPAGRGFPDVAAQGYRFHVIDELANKTNPDILVGGTSASAPAFAAIVALLNNARTSRHLPPLGFLNPWIYSIGHYGLNDVTHGGSTGCTGKDIYSKLPTPVVPFASWNATEGWDPVTGHGTPDFKKLLELSTPGGGWWGIGREKED